MSDTSLADYLSGNDHEEVLHILQNTDFLAIKLFLEEREGRSSPIHLMRNICLSLKEVGDVIAHYQKIENLGIELIGLSLQLYDYSEYILDDETCVTLLEVVVEENLEFFKSAETIPLEAYEKHLKQSIFTNMRKLLERLPTRDVQ